MNTLANDLGVLDASEKNGSTLMDLVGANIDSTEYRDNMETIIDNSVLAISIGGLTYAGSSSQMVTVRPQVSNGILNLKTLHHLCKFQTLPANGAKR